MAHVQGSAVMTPVKVQFHATLDYSMLYWGQCRCGVQYVSAFDWVYAVRSGLTGKCWSAVSCERCKEVQS